MERLVTSLTYLGFILAKEKKPDTDILCVVNGEIGALFLCCHFIHHLNLQRKETLFLILYETSA